MKSEGFWERAAVIDILDEQISMRIIDRCVVRTINKRDVRKLPFKFSRNMFSQLCLVDGLNENNLSVAQENIKARSTIIADATSYDQVSGLLVLEFKFLSCCIKRSVQNDASVCTPIENFL